MQGDRYSRLVAWLKVMLPLAALALLSTLFLLSRSTDPANSIPFADKEIQDRLKNQQVTGPFFSGTTTAGDQISFSADTLTTPDGTAGGNEARGVSAQLDLVSGTRITITSDLAQFDIAMNKASLSGGVRLVTSTGYEINATSITSALSDLRIEAPEGVTANSPLGDLKAGQMALTATDRNSPAHLVFKNGVKLVYDPKQGQE